MPFLFLETGRDLMKGQDERGGERRLRFRMIIFDQSSSGACPRSDGRALKIREAHTLC